MTVSKPLEDSLYSFHMFWSFHNMTIQSILKYTLFSPSAALTEELAIQTTLIQPH